MATEQELAREAKAWPFEEARKLVARYGDKAPPKGYVLFETGYGPSGLPHIGTFGEVARTTMVRQAFQRLAPGVPTRLFAFSDDMDGLRKVPDNIPNREMVAQHLGKPLTQVPDPFGTHESFGHHNNARLRAFLDSYGFEYEFQSSTDWYTSGRFDPALLAVLRHYDEIMGVMLPTLGEERRATYSPFLPVSPSTGRVLQVPMLEINPDAGTVVFQDEDGRKVETPVTGGAVKLQWKPDWGMRWFALGVDYEMAGKDLIPSVELAGKICRILGGTPPEGFNYELFLDDKGQKISKSKGNGLTMEEWLRYAPPESLALYMFQKPRAAKKLFFDVIPRAVDDYLTFVDKLKDQDAYMLTALKDKLSSAQDGTDTSPYLKDLLAKSPLENPAWHIHNGQVPAWATAADQLKTNLSFGILLNLAGAANAENADVMWGFISRYAPAATPANSPFLNRLVAYAVAYYQDRVKPTKVYRAPTDMERAALEELRASLEKWPADDLTNAEALQNEVYEIGKRHAFPELRAWFLALYEVLLGQSTGPRMGSFIALYGVAETKALIDQALGDGIK